MDTQQIELFFDICNTFACMKMLEEVKLKIAGQLSFLKEKFHVGDVV